MISRRSRCTKSTLIYAFAWILVGIWANATQADVVPSFVTDADQNARKDAFLKRSYAEVEQYFLQAHDLVLDHPIVIVGTDQPRTLNTLLNAGLQARNLPPRRRDVNVDQLCANKRLGAAANRHFIVLCWDKQRKDAARLSPAFFAYLTPILAHEMTHHMQYQLARDVPARRLADGSDIVLGPSWMVEGMAELVETDFATPISGFQGKDIFNYQNRARRSRLTLTQLHQSGAVRDAAAYGTARFACLMLARKHGIEALFDYFRALGVTLDRDAAFAQVFGQKMDVFEQEFETLRRDYGAARDYGQDGT